jgi:hypothetical protein
VAEDMVDVQSVSQVAGLLFNTRLSADDGEFGCLSHAKR